MSYRNTPLPGSLLWRACVASLLLSACSPKPQSDSVPVAASTPAAVASAAISVAPTPAPTPVGEFNAPVTLHNKHTVVINHKGELVEPVNKEDYDEVAEFLIKDKVVARNGKKWALWNTKTKGPPIPIGDDVKEGLPAGLIGFRRDGKMGVMDTEGQEVQAPRFDDLYLNGENNFFVYKVNGKQGLMDMRGRKLTEPLYT